MAKAIGTELGERSHSMYEKGSVIQSEKGKRRLVKQVEKFLSSLEGGSICTLALPPPHPTPTHSKELGN